MAITDPQPLSTLLSKALVAFTIEFDNEVEHQLPHRTTNHGATPGATYAPWLISMAMWFNCLRFVDEQGITVRELERLARTPTNLDGMRRWGYITIGPDPADSRPKQPKSAWLVRATPAGAKTRELCQPLISEVEHRWTSRLGSASITRLQSALRALVAQVDPGLPDCMPILGYGFTNADRLTKLPRIDGPGGDEPSIPALLAKVLLDLALAFERESALSLAIYANLLRILTEEPARVRDLPAKSGVSKESLAMAIGLLSKKGLARVESAGKAGRLVVLTPAGLVAQKTQRGLLAETEKRWTTRLGAEDTASLRRALEELIGDDTPENSPLYKGLKPYPDGWRASVPAPPTLPHFPMVLHRGGFPDGS